MATHRTPKQRAAAKRNLVKARARKRRRNRRVVAGVGVGVGVLVASLGGHAGYKQNKSFKNTIRLNEQKNNELTQSLAHARRLNNKYLDDFKTMSSELRRHRAAYKRGPTFKPGRQSLN